MAMMPFTKHTGFNMEAKKESDEEYCLRKVHEELKLQAIEREKIRKRVAQSYSSWLIKTIATWTKQTFLN
jgi:hypothetical protein